MFANLLSVACCLLVVRLSATSANTTMTVNTNEIVFKSNLLHIADCEFNVNMRVTTKEIISQSSLLYTANHEVIRLGVLFGESITDIIVFFIESDVNEQGERVDHGLYALTKDPNRSNHTVVNKLLENARDIAVVLLKEVYFAAKDGIYVYNKNNKSADKYRSINDEVISIAAENATGVVYYVNKQHQLYKLTEVGQKSTTIDKVKNAEQVTVDYKGYLYYYTTDKKLYVYDGLNVKEVKGIPKFPKNLSKVWLMRTPVLAQNFGFVNIDDQYYSICGVHATARALSVGRGALVTSAVSADAGLVMYYAADREIYEFKL